MVIRNKCYNTCFYLHDQFRIRNFFIVRHDTLRRHSWWTEPIHIWIWMPNMENFYYDIVRQSIQIRISPKRGKCTWNSNLWTKCWTERRSHVFKFSDGYKSTMDWCSVYLTPQALSKYNYLSPPLIFPTTSTELGQKTAQCESLRALLHYVEWDRIFAGSKSGLRVTLSYLSVHVHVYA
jgi:hypothetical protein